MKRNIGEIERTLRAFAGLILAGASFLSIPPISESALLGYASIALGLFLVLTAVTGYCPLYTLFEKRGRGRP